MVRFFSHITMSALLVLTATGMTINVHYCQGHLYDMALNAPAHHCCDVDVDKQSCHHDQAQPAKHHCEDETITVESTSDYLVSAISFHFENNHSNDLFFVALLPDEIPGIETQATRRFFSAKEPPPLPEVELARLQRFLI
jgi:hypothetical protein